MTALLTVLACFTGLFACGFGLAGILGLLDFDPPKERQRRWTFVVDQFVAGGIGSMMRDVTHNWPERATERKFVYAGVINGIACIVLVVLLLGST